MLRGGVPGFGELLGELELERGARAVVVDARPGRHRVQVRAGEHHVVAGRRAWSRRRRSGRSARCSRRWSRAGRSDAGRSWSSRRAPCRPRSSRARPGSCSSGRPRGRARVRRLGVSPSLKRITPTAPAACGVRELAGRCRTCRAGSARSRRSSRPGSPPSRSRSCCRRRLGITMSFVGTTGRARDRLRRRVLEGDEVDRRRCCRPPRCRACRSCSSALSCWSTGGAFSCQSGMLNCVTSTS